jgi:Secretion system C-terminal sorting domain
MIMKPSINIRLVVCAILLVIAGFGGQAQGLQLTPGINWVVNGPAQLILHNASLINNGYFSADSGTVIFTGDPANAGAFIGGVNPVAFYNLSIGKSTNDLQLNNNTFVTGRITLDSGNLRLNNYLLDLGSSGSIAGERNEARISGMQGGAIRITAILNSPHAVNPGNIGVEITSAANLGSTVITRGHISQTNSAGETGIQRWFDIVPEMNSNLHTTLRFFYLDDELAGNNKNALTIFSNNEIDNIWTSWGKDAADPSANWVFKSNIDQMHRFTLAIGSGPSIKIYPNPTHDIFTLQLVSGKEGNAIIFLYDQSGNFLEEKPVHWQAGVNTINWNISRYAMGVYYLSIGGPGGIPIKVLRQ